MLKRVATTLVTFAIMLLPVCAMAAGGGDAAHGGGGGAAPHLDGSELGLIWAIPFVGILLSIAVFPLMAPHFWEHHFGKISAMWIAFVAVPFLVVYGWELTLFEALHLLLLEYFPFIILLLALFTVAGGIHFATDIRGTPKYNTAMLAFGTAIASWTGTTGASMLLIRPMIRANAERRFKVHTIVFFIFLVSNIGGALTPLGDPPLFLGFLKGVDFFWPTTNIFLPMLFVALSVLAIYYVLDSHYYKREGSSAPVASGERVKIKLNGWPNVALLGCVVGAVLLSGTWQPGVKFDVFHVDVELQNLVRDVLLLVITFVSYRFTDREHRKANAFDWHPILEVAKLFIGIFVTIVPVIAILKAGHGGVLSGVVGLVTDAAGQPLDTLYFWVTVALSSFLYIAPTYLVFFNAAGGDAEVLMGEMASTLLAISAGAVFMGANTYIGNAPNFMVKAIAESSGIRMPSFFGYMAWSCAILVPLFVLVTLIFFL